MTIKQSLLGIFCFATIKCVYAQAWKGPLIGTSVSTFPFNISSSSSEGDRNYIAPTYPILPFTQYANNPILTPNVQNNWEANFTYNPTAIVIDNKVFMLYRAQNSTLTSSIGLAWSHDGFNFTRLDKPIIYPTEPWEREGGCEDPRIVRVNGTFYVTYTGYNRPGQSPQLVMAASEDLINWRKVPPLFPGWLDVATDQVNGRQLARLNHSKSAAIVREPDANGLYHMYWGDSYLYHATTRDFRNWTSLPAESYFAAPVHGWESLLVEAGPAPIKTRDGKWILIYNGASLGTPSYGNPANGYPGYPPVQYGVGQMLIDPFNTVTPKVTPPQGIYNTTQAMILPELEDGPVARLEKPMVFPIQSEEIYGQVPNVTFCEGIVQFKGKWLLYYGQADTTVGVATAEVQPKCQASSGY